ncbi:histone-lysine N-methyltransferase MLL-like [Arapaima gigas]
MAHSCRLRFPARPGASANGRRSGRIRVTARLRSGDGTVRSESPSALEPGYDAALQVSAAIADNLQTFRDVLGDASGSSSGEEDVFCGFGQFLAKRGEYSPSRNPEVTATQEKRPRGRPPKTVAGSRQEESSCSPSLPVSYERTNGAMKSQNRPSNLGQGKRGHPSAQGSEGTVESEQEKWLDKQSHLGCLQEQQQHGIELGFPKDGQVSKVAKPKWPGGVKLMPCHSEPRSQCGQLSSAKYPKARAANDIDHALLAAQHLMETEVAKQNTFMSQRKHKINTPENLECWASKSTSTPPYSELQKAAMLTATLVPPKKVQSHPRQVQFILSRLASKKASATIARQLLQRAKEGLQKKDRPQKNEAGVRSSTLPVAGNQCGGRGRRTQLRSISQFTMPVVSTVSSRVIKKPKRFIEDETSFTDIQPRCKMPRLEFMPTMPISSSSGAVGVSCTDHSPTSVSSSLSPVTSLVETRSQFLNGNSNNSNFSQTSDFTVALSSLSQEGKQSSVPHTSQQPISLTKHEHCLAKKGGHRGRRGQGSRRSNLMARGQSSSQAAYRALSVPSSSMSAVSSTSEHSPNFAWIMPHRIGPFVPIPKVPSPVCEGRRSILRQPTFLWTSLSTSERQGFSSAKYAKEGLIRRPVFDNFHPSPLTAEDVGLPSPASGTSVPGGSRTFGTGKNIFQPLPPHPHLQSPPWPRTFLCKLRPLLRAPCFTPSEAHSRIYESVTLPAPVRPSAPPRAPTAVDRTVRNFGRRTLRSQPRMSSHSMTTRSSRLGVQTALLKSSACPISSGGLTFNSSAAFASFSTASVTHTLKRSFGETAITSSQVFSLFSSSVSPAERVRSTEEKEPEASILLGLASGEKEQESKKSADQVQEGKMDRRKKDVSEAKGAHQDAIGSDAPGPFTLADRNMEESPLSPPPENPLSCADPGAADNGSEAGPGPQQSFLSLESRITEDNMETIAGQRVRISAPLQQTTQSDPAQTHASAPSLGSPPTQSERQAATSQHVVGLLKKAGAQLCKIKRSSALRAEEPTEQGLENTDSLKVSVRGPRIKHVCRRAAAALGQRRAVFPDDVPTLSALPWGEKERILSSAGSKGRDANSFSSYNETQQTFNPEKPVTKHKMPLEAPTRRGRRCGQCPGCAVPEDCGICANCLDKPKFGGRNIKKQCCRVRKCQNLQSMSSLLLAQKQGKVKKAKTKGKKSTKKGTRHSAIKRQLVHYPLQEDPGGSQSRTLPSKSFAALTPVPSLRDLTDPPQPPNPPLLEEPSWLTVTTTQKEQRSNSPLTLPCSDLSPTPNTKQNPCPPPQCPIPPGQHKHCPPSQSPPPSGQQKHCPPSQSSPPPGQLKHCPPSQSPPPPGQHKPTSDLRSDTQGARNRLQKYNPVNSSSNTELDDNMKNEHIPPLVLAKQRPKEKLTPMSLQVQSTPLNSLIPPFEGDHDKRGSHCDGKNLRGFSHGTNADSVWEMGGLGILTAAHSGPQFLCFLCASAGKVEFVFCQVCCEPFHLFCLEEMERPQQEQLKNWCCRLCRTCSLCHRQHLNPRLLLECAKCGNHYHPECLEPHHPTTLNKTKIWICPKCVRCRKCGSTKPGESKEARWSCDYSLCHQCVKESFKDECCLLCDKQCNEDCSDGVRESKMIQCAKCGQQVHAKCENISEEMYEILCSHLEGVAYTCKTCALHNPVDWRTALQSALQSSLQQVLSMLLDSPTSQHLQHYSLFLMKAPELNLELEERLPSSCSPERPGPPMLADVLALPPDLVSVKRKTESGQYTSVMDFSNDIVRIIQAAIRSKGGDPEKMKANCVVKSFFIRLMERVFPWFKVKESRFWEVKKVSSSCGPTPSAMLPRLEHSYAQQCKRDRISPAEKAVGSLQPSDSNVSYNDDTKILTQPDMSDRRRCVFCLLYGDADANNGGRLLYIGWYEWAHVNCVLWSTEVFEDEDGTLKNVHMAVVRGKQLYCDLCQRPGATVGCCLASCSSNFHFMCARRQHCAFLEDRQVYCQQHKGLAKGEGVSEAEFEVMRRILVDPKGISLRKSYHCGLNSEDIRVMIGKSLYLIFQERCSMTVECLGMLKQLSECEGKLFPIGYQCSRVYWSTTDAHRRSLYTCKILRRHPLSMGHGSKCTAVSKESQNLLCSSFSELGGFSTSAPDEITAGLSHSSRSATLLPVVPKGLGMKVPMKMSSTEQQNCKVGPLSQKDQSKALVNQMDGIQHSSSSLVKNETLTCARALPAPVALVRPSKFKKADCGPEVEEERNNYTDTSTTSEAKTKSYTKLKTKRSFQVGKKNSKLRVSTTVSSRNVSPSGTKTDTTKVFHTPARQDGLNSSKLHLFSSASMGLERSELDSQQESPVSPFTSENEGILVKNSDSTVLSKQQYLPRSTRVRSSMLFGQTSFSSGEKEVSHCCRENDAKNLRSRRNTSSAKGQVDTADCVSTSSSEHNIEEEESGMNRDTNSNSHYCNSTRTAVSSGNGAPSPGEIEICPATESQDKTMKEKGSKEKPKEGAVLTGCLSHFRITQLDGIDDGSESDTSVSTSSIPKNNCERKKVTESQIDTTKTDSGKGVENSSGTRENSIHNGNESKKNRKETCLPTEVQPSISADLLSIGCDDCGNILPSDIMEFVLNTPSLQALGQQEASSELVSLDERFSLQGDQGKDISLFEDFAQPLPVESCTNVSEEEPYNLPLVLPSDLSVLTTSSPSASEPKHGAVILKQNIASVSPPDSGVWKGTVKQREGTEGSSEDQPFGNGLEASAFKQSQLTSLAGGHIEAPDMAIPPLSQAVEPETKDLKKESPPSLLLQRHNTPVPMEIQDPIHAASIAAHLTPSPENLIVLNQPLHPLYLVHSLPNCGTQKIQIVAPVTTTGGIDTGFSALNSMTGKVDSTAGLSTRTSASQAILSPAGKGAVFQGFTDPKQKSLQPGLAHTSGLLPSVQSHNSNVLGTASGLDLTLVSSSSSPSPMVLTSGHGTKRPISRLQPRKVKKQARSNKKPKLAPTDVMPSKTLVNVLPSQMAASLVQLSTSTASTSHQKVTRIIKWPKPGYVYLEPATAVLPQGISLNAGQPGFMGQDSSTPLLPCTVSGLNVLSVPGSSTNSFMGPAPLNIHEPQIVIQSGPSQLISPLTSPSQAPLTKSICVLSTHQVVGFNQLTDHENISCLEHKSVTQVVLDKLQNVNATEATHGSVPVEQNPVSHGLNRNVMIIPSQNSQHSDHYQEHNNTTVDSLSMTENGEQKCIAGKASGNKHKTSQETEEAGSACPFSPSNCKKASSPGLVHTEEAKTNRRVTEEVDSFGRSEVKVLPDPKTEEGWLSMPNNTPCRRDILSCGKSMRGVIFEIHSDDGFYICSDSIEEAWRCLTDKVQQARSKAGLKKLYFEDLDGLRMLGVVHNTVLFLLEHLHGFQQFQSYRFKFRKSNDAGKPSVSPQGSARTRLYHRLDMPGAFTSPASQSKEVAQVLLYSILTNKLEKHCNLKGLDYCVLH